VVDTRGIWMEGICFRIGDFTISDLTMEVRGGEYFVLTGPNGAGKTILIKLIAGIFVPSMGSIEIDGTPVRALPPWRRNIGYVPQEGILFPNRTVGGNIGFGLEVRHTAGPTKNSRVNETAEMLGIEHLLDRIPQGLSGGERQKVALARALVIEPSVLLLDEPVSAIDEDTRDDLCRELRRIQEETCITTIHVSHSRKETELVADRVGVLKNGTFQNAAD